MSIITSEVYSPAGKVTVKLTILAGTYDVIAHQCEISPISCGNDDDSDLSNLINRIDIRLHYAGLFSEFIDLLGELYSNTTSVKVWLGTDSIFAGWLDQSTIEGDTLQQVFKVTAYDATQELKKVDPRINPRLWELNTLASLSDLIADHLFPAVTALTLGSISTNILAKVTDSGTTYEDIPFGKFMTYPGLYFDTDCYYDNMLSLLKSIFLNYNLIAYVDLYRRLHAIPRTHSAIVPTAITKTQIRQLGEFNYIEPYDGVLSKIYTGKIPQNDESNYVERELGDASGRRVENLRILQPGGMYSGQCGFSSVFLDLGSNGTVAVDPGVQSFRIQRLDGTYTSYQYLYELIADKSYNMVSSPRKRIRVTVTGLVQGFFFTLPFFSDIFRAGKIEWDIMNNQTILSLRQVEVD
jgi:hypothetical protein